MLKKLLTLAAVAALGLSANAAVVEDYVIDYTTTTWNFYVMGYIPSQENGWLTVTQTRGSWERVDGEAVYTPNDDKDEDGLPDIAWYQLFVADGIQTNIDVDYTVTMLAKADVEASANMNMQWGWGDGQQLSQTFNFGTDWDEISVTYPSIGGNSCALVFQPGTQETTFDIKWIKVSHTDNSKPVEWVNLLINGDAEGEYGDMACAYSKEYGYNNNEPHPAFIEEMDGGHVFVCHATAMVEQPWDNQFWIVAPKTFKKGDSFRVSFDAKAAKAGASVATQQHAAPGAYQHWAAIGNIAFSTDWEPKGGNCNVEQDGMYSIALNLNDFADANDYYFDNIKWETMKLDEGYFAAGDFCDKVLDDAIEFGYNADDEVYICVVGTPDKYASNLKISTVRGNDNEFNNHLLKFDAPLDDEDVVDIQEGKGNKWVELPWAAIWMIELDDVYGQITFYEVADEDYNENWADDLDGINSVSADFGAAVYYNLQGVQVNNPTSGQIYIVKKNNKTYKAVIR